ncbi:MAG: 1-phosphofructokinase [Ignavibacteriales bacterium]|nr:1-phosphofructokinase [Ignavibacteriales bacterium]
MILSVTINPLLERVFLYDKINLGQVNRCAEEQFRAGGKGINVCRQLNYLQMKNIALTFAGGNNGKIFRSILKSENIDFVTIPTKSETRSAALIFESENNRLTSYFGPNMEILQSEVNEFKIQLEKMIKNCSIVVFSGSSPNKVTDEIFSYGIELANNYDKISILDTYGDQVKECIEKQPTVLHNNKLELEKSLGFNLANEEAICDCLNYLHKKNIKLGFITDGKNPIYASKFDFHYKIENPIVDEIDSTGSGDAFVAGLVYGLEKAMIFDEFVKIAASLGVANATKFDLCNSDRKEIENYFEKIRIFPIGKKMKIIDDSPNY